MVKNSDIPAQQATVAPNSESSNDPGVIDFRQVGVSGLKRFSGFIYDEFLRELTGWQGVAVYKEMSRNDAMVGACLYAIKMLCRKAKWFVNPSSGKPQGKQAAEFLETCMNDMSETWIDVVNEALSMLEYGFAPCEIVYKRRCGDVFDPSMRSKYADGRIGWRSMGLRSQDTIYRWQFDDHGGIQGLEQIAPPHYYRVVIPVEKMLLFRTRADLNNPEGISILRTAYRSWYNKKNIENIEAIGVERDLAGLPVAMVPPELLSQNASPDQKQLLAAIQNIIVNIRRNEQEGVIFPLNYDQNGNERYQLKLMSSGGNRQFDTNAIINRYDSRIAMTMLADFIMMGHDKVGSFAMVSTKTNLFSTAIGGFLDIVASVINRYAVPRLFAMNDFVLSDYPQVAHGDIGSQDLDALGTFLLKLSQSGMPLFPNNELQRHLLGLAGCPTAEAAPEDEPGIQITDTASADKPEIEIPNSPVQTPSGFGVKDRTPADGKPNPPSVVTNGTGTTEETSFAGAGSRTPDQFGLGQRI